jgi:ribosomal protein S18 acetylase RimI-like enzyme
MNYKPQITGLTFRHFQGEDDYLTMLTVREQSKEYDKVDPLSTLESIPTLEQLKEELHEEHSDPYKDVLIAEKDGKVIGYNHVCWWTEEDGTWLYLHLGYLLPQWRNKGIGTTMLHSAENHILELAKTHVAHGKKMFGSNATSTEKEKTALLLREGYTPVWTLAEFEFTDFATLPDISLPAGFTIKLVEENHLRMIYDANHEVYAGTWGHTAPSEEDFQEFIKNVDTSLWQVAWDDDQIAGFVLSEIRNGRGEMTEVSVRKPWRRMGLAYVLLVKNLQELKKRGVSVVRLHTDAEGKAGARSLYEKTGFKHLKDVVRYRKPIK